MTDTTMREAKVATDDGACPVYLHTPAGAGSWPGVILYMDGPGIRPAIQEIAARLAAAGFAVMLPDLFYRAGSYAPIDAKHVFTDPDLRAAHRERYMSTVTPRNAMADSAALLTFMDECREIAAGPIGVVGYCMGGRLALIAAGTFPERVVVAASYHGGGLANDAPSSPHLLASRMNAKVYVAGAIEDPNFTDDMKQRLEKALAKAGVDHAIETYPAKHGWVPRDTAAHDPAQAEHHWHTLIPLLEGVLKSG